MRRAAVVVLALLAAGLLAVTLVVGHRAPTNAERVQHLSGELRCPTCVAQTVAGSNTPVAEGMRAEVTRQVAAGRSDSQILSWFRQRYGEDIVLMPSHHGIGPILWVAPGGALAIGIGAILWRRRRRGADRRQQATPEHGLPNAWLAAVLALAVASGVAVPVAFSLQHQTGAADAAPAAAATTSPSGSASTLPAETDPIAAAFELLKSGQPDAAEAIVRRLADRPGKTGTLALLVLGLAERAAEDPAATATLRRFVREHPKHPAAAQVRRLLHQ